MLCSPTVHVFVNMNLCKNKVKKYGINIMTTAMSNNSNRHNPSYDPYTDIFTNYSHIYRLQVEAALNKHQLDLKKSQLVNLQASFLFKVMK